VFSLRQWRDSAKQAIDAEIAHPLARQFQCRASP
jgi:hypothetical protein